MSGNFAGVVWTLVLIFTLLGAAYFVSRRNAELARKIIHIGVAHWYFIYVAFFTDPLPAVLGLAAFAAFNAFLTSKGVFSSSADKEGERRSWGMVWYPLSVLIMVLLSAVGIGDNTALGCGLLGMGWGDGLAALIGKRFGKRRIYGNKTWAGTLTAFAAITAVSLLISRRPGMALVCGIVGAVLETFTPRDLDNISVPLGIYAVAAVWSAYV